MTTYYISASEVTVNATVSGTDAINASALLLKLSFGAPAQNDTIVCDAVAEMQKLKQEHGPLVLLNGPASLPVAVAIAHAIAHQFGAVGVFDPKMNGYVVAVSHDPKRPIGSVIPTSDVKES